MKKLLHWPKRASDAKPEEALQPTTSQPLTDGSRDSITDLPPMFLSTDDTHLNNDVSLNLNPSILNTQSNQTSFTKDKSELFSRSRKTFSTNQTSVCLGGDAKVKLQQVESGQPLHILDTPQGLRSEMASPEELVREKIHEVYLDTSFSVNQYKSSVTNLSTAVINTIESIKLFNAFVLNIILTDGPKAFWKFTTFNNTDVRKLMKLYLEFYDDFLHDAVYVKLKVLLVKNFNDFLVNLSHFGDSFSSQETYAMTKPQNFAVGANDGETLPNQEVLVNIINKISATSTQVKEQNGSFIAPIARGISKDLNILCLYFGYPNPTEYHYKMARSLHDLYDDIHFVVMKNLIEPAALSSSPFPRRHKKAEQSELKSPESPRASTPISATSSINSPPPNNLQKFKLPFRIPLDPLKPPISMSISTEASEKISGTVGGFIYPKIDEKSNPHLKQYLHSKFAMTCGHVCLGDSKEFIEYPHVSSPLSVLISLYKHALLLQYMKAGSSESVDLVNAEARVAYGNVLRNLDELFPLKKIKIADKKTKTELYETKNLPLHRFGQIIWGERTLTAVKHLERGEEVVNKRLSDLAIIKVNNKLNCDQNFLGDDIAFNEFDPSLMFDNLYVRSVLNLSRDSKAMDLNIDDVDSHISNDKNNDGIPVFKYGSTTKFTKGNLNGIKMVFWLDGAIHSSEFVVNSIENNSAFAAGGDSGSWVLAKLEDCRTVEEFKGLCVLGMLHSYDGEFRQFGLFTPMTEILERLEEVTNIRWGVVGVNEKSVGDINEEVTSDEYPSDLEDLSRSGTPSLKGDPLSPEID